MAKLDIAEVERAGSAGELVILALKGEIAPRSVGTLKDHLTRLAKSKTRHVILDMSETSYVNSSALAVLVKFAHTFRDKEGSIAITNVNPRVKLPFEMLGLLVFIRSFDSVAEARAAIMKEL